MAEKGMNQGVIQIGTGEAVRLKEAASIVAGLAKKHVGKSVETVFDRSKPEGDRGRISINTRAKDILGWSPLVGIHEGLDRTFEWILSDMDAKRNAPAPDPKALPFIPQMVPWFGEEEADQMDEYMRAAAKGEYNLTEWKKTAEFERMLADFIGAKHCIVVNNGTVTLSLALLAVGVQPGDDVLVPDWTMVATPNSAKMIGANPVFVDIDPKTWCIDIDKIEAAITPKTKAIVHVQMNARSNDIVRLAALCKARGIPLVEDSAQALGSYHNGKHLGTFGDVSSFSFSAPKIISTGQGGALITNDDELAAKIKKMKDFGRNSGGNDSHGVIGWNFKFTDMQAVVGIEQMKKLPWRVKRMREMYQLYRKHLSGVRQVSMNDHDLSEQGWLPWFVDIFVDDRNQLRDHLKTVGIGTRAVYPPLHQQEAYAERNNMHYPVTEYISSRGLWLPSSSKLTDQEIKRVCDAIREYYATKDAQQSQETVLVVGAAGYVGSACVLHLINDTNFKVKAFDNLSYEGASLFPFFAYKNRFQFIKGDIRTVDYDKLMEGVTMVVNFCALVGEPICKKFPTEAVEINLDSNLALAQAAERAGVKRYVFSSTCSNYGTQEGLLTEEAKLQPISIYADTKVKSEDFLMNKVQKLPAVVLRYATAYGLAARVRFDLLVHEFIRDAWVEKEIKIFGADGWRPLCHVDDLARAAVTVFEQSASLPHKDIFNVGSNDQNVTKRSIGELVQARLGNKLDIVGAGVKVDPRSYRVDFSKFENATGFRARLRPVDAINDICLGLESGAITKKTLYEAVNVPVSESVQEIAKAALKKLNSKSCL